MVGNYQVDIEILFEGCCLDTSRRGGRSLRQQISSLPTKEKRMTQQQTQAAFHMLHAPYRARMPGLPRAENAAIPLSRLLAIVILTAWSSPFAAAQSAANSGCGNPPYTSCTDPVPATFISGSWIETDSASEWTLTANNASPGVAGTVTGTVLVVPIAPLCPVINYTIAAPGPSFYRFFAVSRGLT